MSLPLFLITCQTQNNVTSHDDMSSPSQRVTEKDLQGPLGLLELRRFTLGSFLLCAKLVFVILEGAVAAD